MVRVNERKLGSVASSSSLFFFFFRHKKRGAFQEEDITAVALRPTSDIACGCMDVGVRSLFQHNRRKAAENERIGFFSPWLNIERTQSCGGGYKEREKEVAKRIKTSPAEIASV